jgi:hypothetical protein
MARVVVRLRIEMKDDVLIYLKGIPASFISRTLPNCMVSSQLPLNASDVLHLLP